MLTQQQQIFEQIKKAENILITFKKTWNGDAVASALAMYLFLKKMDKQVTIAAEKFATGKLFSFLPSYAKISNNLDNLRKFVISLDITNTKVDKIKYTIEDNVLNFVISPQGGFFTPDDISSKASGFKFDLIITIDIWNRSVSFTIMTLSSSIRSLLLILTITPVTKNSAKLTRLN